MHLNGPEPGEYLTKREKEKELQAQHILELTERKLSGQIIPNQARKKGVWFGRYWVKHDKEDTVCVLIHTGSDCTWAWFRELPAQNIMELPERKLSGRIIPNQARNRGVCFGGF